MMKKKNQHQLDIVWTFLMCRLPCKLGVDVCNKGYCSCVVTSLDGQATTMVIGHGLMFMDHVVLEDIRKALAAIHLKLRALCYTARHNSPTPQEVSVNSVCVGLEEVCGNKRCVATQAMEAYSAWLDCVNEQVVVGGGMFAKCVRKACQYTTGSVC